MNNAYPQMTAHALGALLLYAAATGPLAAAQPTASAKPQGQQSAATTPAGAAAARPVTGQGTEAPRLLVEQPTPLPGTAEAAAAAKSERSKSSKSTTGRTSASDGQENSPKTAAPSEWTAADIVARMNAALAPGGTLLGVAEVYAEREGSIVVQHGLQLARGVIDGKVHTSIAFTDPSPYAGTAMMWGNETAEGEAVEAIYLPAERRVREVDIFDPEEKLLRTDFTRANLFLVPPRAQKYRLLGKSTSLARETYRVEGKPLDPLYYSRIVTWIAADSWLPVRREYYDRAGRLWKIATYNDLVVAGDAVLTSIALDDVQLDTRSVLELREIQHLQGDGRELFDTDHLTRLSQHSAWDSLTQIE